MRKLLLIWTLFVVGVISALVWLAPLPARAGTVYSWRTDDGVYAFTDDREAIPARYRDGVRTRSSARLRHYDRYTPQVAGSGAAYTADLVARLEHLRAFNAIEPPTRIAPGTAGIEGTAGTIRLSLGNDAPSIDIRADGEGPPIVIETLYTRPDGGVVTRKSVVVRRGDKTLAVVMPRSRETNVNEIVDERDFR